MKSDGERNGFLHEQKNNHQMHDTVTALNSTLSIFVERDNGIIKLQISNTEYSYFNSIN